MSGSMTITSRGRKVGSALKRANSWSWRISTSRCGLCAIWKRIERSFVVSTAGHRSRLSASGRNSRMSSCSSLSSVVGEPSLNRSMRPSLNTPW
ncbi:hypothetical protein D3C75_1018250 [compost metagenome]